MQPSRALLFSLLALALSGCAPQSEVDSLRRDMDEMKSRLFATDKSINEVRGEVKEGVEKSLAGYRSKLDAMQKDMASIRKEGADLQATLDSARVDQQGLNGRLDDIRIMAQKPAEDIILLREDLAKRLTALDQRISKLEADFVAQQAKAAEAAQTPEALYQQAMDAMNGGDMAKSRELWMKFLERYPKHKLAANAHYWLGEGYYSSKTYDQAVLEFQEVIDKYPGNEKIPAAMLKQGMSFKAMGDNQSAQYILKKLVEEYPKSDEARLAKERLRSK
ncbi:tol-pal system protein YbgF [Geomonas sp.]|uniref:tol-pal system protein YbgF n=1 Tax=Geomonas sp. TaxID=2651584 RepID=UPI002B45E397|nr:tol-pal system protein YbgF [Geomonas sp.]HJV36922.1 tol-pal system protein YbgF [Geomonas sp.]